MNSKKRNASFSEMLGEEFVKVERIDDDGQDAILFHLGNGSFYKMHHNQDCCECVYIESIVGDLDDLVGERILLAEECVSETQPEWDKNQPDPDDSTTWTFYKLATRKGYVDIRWVGGSNGYYSETVDLEYHIMIPT